MCVPRMAAFTDAVQSCSAAVKEGRIARVDVLRLIRTSADKWQRRLTSETA